MRKNKKIYDSGKHISSYYLFLSPLIIVLSAIILFIICKFAEYILANMVNATDFHDIKQRFEIVEAEFQVVKKENKVV